MSPSEEVLHRPPLEEKLGYFLYQQSLEDSETLTQFNTFLLDHPNQPAGITTDSSTLFDAACASLVQHYGLEKDALKEHPLVKDGYKVQLILRLIDFENLSSFLQSAAPFIN